MSDLTAVDDVEQNGGDDAADGVGQHEDHHPLPAPQRDFSFTTGDRKSVKHYCTAARRITAGEEED